MSVNQNPSQRSLVALFIFVAVATVGGRILSTQRVYEPALTTSAWPKTRPAIMPTFGSNDRSRWATIRSLVDEGTYVIGKRDLRLTHQTAILTLAAQDPLQVSLLAVQGYDLRVKSDDGIIFKDGWQSVDKVLHPSELLFYSSKPPLLATLLAPLYWLLQTLFGWTLATDPAAVVRTILLLVNALPFALYLIILSRVLEKLRLSDWTRWFILAVAGFGTLVTPFLITLNNHTLGTFSVLFALGSLLVLRRAAPIEKGGLAGTAAAPARHFICAGFFSAFAVCNELPALAFAAAVGVLLLWWFPRRTLLIFAPAFALPIAGFFVTNYAAVGQLRPAYSEFGGPWYEYEGSHWRPPTPGKEKDKRGIDWAKYHETRLDYAVHLLVGHHGFFSLTPVWLLALGVLAAGTLSFWRNWQLARAGSLPPAENGAAPPPSRAGPDLAGLPWWLPAFTLGISLVVIGFYLFKSDNYGGFSNGPRWLMWLTPLWLLCLAPAIERLQASPWIPWGRGLAYAALGFSILTAFYQSWNPWRHPWIYDLLLAGGWGGY